MSHYQLIAFDMDGTLLDSEKQLRPSSIRAIRQAAQAGKEVILCSGRCVPELWMHFPQLPEVRYAIAVSGAMVYDRKEDRVLFSHSMEPETVDRVLARTRDRDVMIQLLTKDRSVVEAGRIRRMPDYHMQVHTELYERVCTKPENLPAYWEEHREPIPKLNIYHRSPQQREETIRLLQNEAVELTATESVTLECNAPGVSKGPALLELCAYLGIDPKDTIAVGDSENDLSVLQAAGFGIAMGNAIDRVKELCGAVVDSCDGDGCAQAIERYLL